MDSFVADVIFIDAGPARVFAALVDPEEVLEWMGAEFASVSGELGGEFLVRRPDGSEVCGTVAESEPGVRLKLTSYMWSHGDVERGPMRVVFELAPHDGGVWFSVRQDDLDRHSSHNSPGDWRDFARATREEWVAATVALKRHIEQI